MIEWTYADIEAKIRATTGRPDVSQMSSATILDYANRYYQLVLPKELKIFWGYTFHDFFVYPGKDQYVAPPDFQTLNPSVTCDGFPIEWYLSPDTFYQDWPKQLNKQEVATGDGSNPTFVFNVSAYPIVPGSLYVTDGTITAQDNGNGGFDAPFTGSINYTQASVSVTFPATQVPALDASIQASYQTYQANRPQAILFFKQKKLAGATLADRQDANMFVVRPIPDSVYQIKLQGIQAPPQFVLGTDVPFRPDLGPLIAYGASLEIFADFNQMDQYDQTMVQYNRYKDISMQDTYEEYLYTRSIPRF